MTDTNVTEDSSSAPSVGNKRTAEVAFEQSDTTLNENATTNQAPARVGEMGNQNIQQHICLLSARLAFKYIDQHAANSYLDAHMHMIKPRTEDDDEADKLFKIFISSVEHLSSANQRGSVLSWAQWQAMEGLELMCESDPAMLQWVKAGLRYFAQP
ncbi:hypothetical protein LTR56_019400 [Elasticomyces elasticus]|nr:hypothetical protein LTR22_023426 [Elasticomyces elasticus]KAK3627076.1 hypothetical protein LTR56_019400 [Elasticomyces elasticus]KAK4904716.1 hypothetical protein LTR49_025887 [Elasticomyces elasticus]KAK5746524.1 hypothetical protein LTS12_022707 [Elasticomyces elasticus]